MKMQFMYLQSLFSNYLKYILLFEFKSGGIWIYLIV